MTLYFSFGAELFSRDRLRKLAESILLAPRLLRIYARYGSEESYLFRDVTPDRWCENALQGSLVRSYSKGIESFLIVRVTKMCRRCNQYIWTSKRRSRHSDRKEEKRHAWYDIGTYNGNQKVSGERISRVYEILGASVDWEEPGRDLQMPESAWEVVRASTGEAESRN